MPKKSYISKHFLFKLPNLQVLFRHSLYIFVLHGELAQNHIGEKSPVLIYLLILRKCLNSLILHYK